MAIGRDEHRFKVVGVLALARGTLRLAGHVTPGLLHDFVGYLVTRQGVSSDEIETVVGSQVALVIEGEIAECSAVRVVLRDDGVQIMVGLRAGRRDAQNILSPSILGLSEGRGDVVAATGENDLSVKSGLR